MNLVKYYKPELGCLASEETRKARCAAHDAFDVIWRYGRHSRSSAYYWLAGRMKLHPDDCHMKLMSAEQCNRVVKICKKYTEKRSFENEI